MTVRRYKPLQTLTVAFGLFALFAHFGLAAYAQGCDVGQRVKGNSTIKKMYAGPSGGGFDVEAVGTCGPGMIFVSPNLIRGTAGNCREGARVAFSGVIRQKGKSAYLHADSARCP